jgi:hypothetical protein
MKRIVYLSFYFKPDLCAGSFRNSPLAIELAKQSLEKNVVVDVYTTLPNRYSTFDIRAQEYEKTENLTIHRIPLPAHKSGMLDQIFAFWHFYNAVLKLNQSKKADLVFASSSRLFTAYLGYKLASKYKALLYIDIRDIFVDTMNDVIKSKLLKVFVLPILKIVEAQTFNYAKHINLISEGFKEYFERFNTPKYSFFSNGIDEEFLARNDSMNSIKSKKRGQLIVYAGNIGEGQGLHKIIPQTALILGSGFEFLIIGDGAAKKALSTEIRNLGLNNVEVINPISRLELQFHYENADYLFLHLNDYPAFRKVLPSKIFELATFNKPILAGVSGYAARFMNREVSDSFLFEPCNVYQLVDYLRTSVPNQSIERSIFVKKYNRAKINEEMATNILGYI